MSNNVLADGTNTGNTASCYHERTSEWDSGSLSSFNEAVVGSLKDKNDKTISDIDEADWCGELCLGSRDAYGFTCRSFDHTAGNTCYLSSRVMADGTNTGISTSRYYERSSIPITNALDGYDDCVEGYLKLRNSQQIDDIDAADWCALLCDDAENLYGFVCRSFDWESDSERCLLSTDTADDGVLVDSVSFCYYERKATDCAAVNRADGETAGTCGDCLAGYAHVRGATSGRSLCSPTCDLYGRADATPALVSFSRTANCVTVQDEDWRSINTKSEAPGCSDSLLTRFRMVEGESCSSRQRQFENECLNTADQPALTCSEKSTSCAGDDGFDKFHRHDLDCGDDKLLKSWDTRGCIFGNFGVRGRADCVYG